MCTVRYLRPGWRRPVGISPWPQQDVQGAIPAGWCETCGAEVFAWEHRLCRRCLKRGKERLEYEDQSLFDLHPGGKPDRM